MIQKTISNESIIKVGSFLGTNYVVTSDGKVLLTGRHEGTQEVRDDSVLSSCFSDFIKGSRGDGYEELAEKIGRSDYLKATEERNSRLLKRDRISIRHALAGLDIEDMVTSATRERWDYIERIARGDVRISGVREFDDGDFLIVPKRRSMWYGKGGQLQYQLDPQTLSEDKDAVVGYKEFCEGDFVVVTEHDRMVYGKNGILKCELDTLTLQEKKDEFIPASAFVGFDRERGYGKNGGNGKSRNDGTIILRNVSDFYDAVINVACGKSHVFEYRLNRDTKDKGWIGQLENIQRARTSFGEGAALKLAREYSINDRTSWMLIYREDSGRKESRVVNRHLNPRISVGGTKTTMPKELPTIYAGTRSLPAIDTCTVITYMLLGFVGTFVYSGGH